MTERRDAEIHGVPAVARAEAIPPSIRVELALIASRLALIGVLLSVGLGVARFMVGAGVPWWRALLAGAASFVAAILAIQRPWSRRQLARFAEWVLPARESGG